MSPAYVAHGLTLALAWFAVVNLALCVAVVIVAAVAGARDIRRPGFWLGMRLLPAAAAAVFVVILFVPSYWRYEPREMVEGFDVSLTILALAALAIAGGAIHRGVRSWRRVARRSERWMRSAQPLALDAGKAALPAFAIDAEQPMIALVGIVRPRLLVTRGLLKILTPAELAASVAHELCHQRALDNLKRLAMSVAPDVLSLFGAAAAIERKWASAAEHIADRRAGRDGAAVRCALASALVKVARLMPEHPPAAEPVSTLVGGGEITSRVQALLSDREPSGGRSHLRLLGGAAVIGILAFVAVYPLLLRIVHIATETLVHLL